MLWAASYFGERVKLTAVEPVFQVVGLFRQSIAANNFNHLIDLHLGFASDTTKPYEPGRPQYLRVDDIVKPPVDILKIHTNGGEDKIIKGS